MVKAPHTEELHIDGPAGRLQAMLETPADLTAAASRVAIVCHPHPLYEGTMHNKVVHVVARTMTQLGMPALRFNFRGVEDSAGSYGDIEGEVEDLLAVAAWVRRRWPGADIWLAGFSFGGLVASLAAERIGASQLLGIAPAVSLLKDGEFEPPRMPWFIVQGDADEVVSPDEVADWVAAHAPGPDLVTMPGVGHFFHGQLGALKKLLLDKYAEPAGRGVVE